MEKVNKNLLLHQPTDLPACQQTLDNWPLCRIHNISPLCRRISTHTICPAASLWFVVLFAEHRCTGKIRGWSAHGLFVVWKRFPWWTIRRFKFNWTGREITVRETHHVSSIPSQSMTCECLPTYLAVLVCSCCLFVPWIVNLCIVSSILGSLTQGTERTQGTMHHRLVV